MTVNPGFGGQKFIDNGIEKIKFLKDYKEKYHLNYEIEVDGGVNEVTAKTCIEAGADVLVAGSYFFKHKDLSIPTSVLRGE